MLQLFALLFVALIGRLDARWIQLTPKNATVSKYKCPPEFFTIDHVYMGENYVIVSFTFGFLQIF
jgi:hypothetical protein